MGAGRWLRNGAAREHAKAAGNPEWETVVWALVERGDDQPDWYAYEPDHAHCKPEWHARRP